MRPLLAALMLSCVPTQVVREPAPLPEPIVDRTPPAEFDVQFLRKTPPVMGELFVCGIIPVDAGEVFSCVDFDVFMKALLADAPPERTAVR